jgi:hypothetical protein
MLTSFGFMLKCSHCEGYHIAIDPEFDGWQWWDHCPMGCGFTPHGNGAGLDAAPRICEDQYDVRPVPEI